MRYLLAERFKSIQGEGVYAGTPMAFIRFVGCSVGKKICHACDTDFEQPMTWRGGGEYQDTQLVAWAGEYEHVCLTGGEPFDQDLMPLLEAFRNGGQVKMVHVETSGTKHRAYPGYSLAGGMRMWTCVSPKPGFLEEVVQQADEVKVIVPGLGTLAPARKDAMGFQEPLPRWPTIEDARRWATLHKKTVFLQPRNGKHEIDQNNLRIVLDIIAAEPYFRLSLQMHKLLKVQ